MLRRWLCLAVAAVVVGTSAEIGVAAKAFGPPLKVPPGFVHCRTPDGVMKVKNKPKLNILFVASAPGHEADSFRFTAFKSRKKILRIVEVGIDAMPFATLDYPVDVPAQQVIAFAYSRRDMVTNTVIGSWEMDGGSAVHVRLQGYNPKKRRLWGTFSAEGLHDTLGGNGPIDISGGVFNLKQALPQATK